VSDWTWFVWMFLVFGGGSLVLGVLEVCGTGLGKLADGRGKRRALKRELNAVQQENTRLHKQLEQERDRPAGGPEFAAMMEQARIAIDQRAFFIDILNRVQTADEYLRQLPPPVRRSVDDALAMHRAALMPVTATRITVEKKRGKS